MKHIIGKQVIDLQIGSDQKASVLQHQFSQLYWKDIVPAMDKLFDQFSGKEEVVAIDRLEIDLGFLSVNSIQKEMIIPILKQALEKWFQQHKVQSDVIQRKPIRSTIFEQWLFFLNKGYFSWNVQELPKDWQTTVVETLAGNAQAVYDLREQLSKDHYSVKRLIQQYNHKFIQKIIETFTAKKQDGLSAFVETISTTNAKETFWEFIIEKTILQEEKWDDEILVKAYRKQSLQTPKSNQSLSTTVPVEKDNTQITKEGLYIQNAGIVLLQPFLSRFFKHCELQDGNDFKDHEAASKAIHLLHYLATNETQPGEEDLSLLKFLCAVPFNVPLRKELVLSEAEKEEADALLQAAIKHWGALGEVSNASLQETFLQRDGKLLQTESGWKLQVEKKTVDVLLSQLPWNVSIVKLAWMGEMLKVDWI